MAVGLLQGGVDRGGRLPGIGRTDRGGRGGRGLRTHTVRSGLWAGHGSPPLLLQDAQVVVDGGAQVLGAAQVGRDDVGPCLLHLLEHLGQVHWLDEVGGPQVRGIAGIPSAARFREGSGRCSLGDRRSRRVLSARGGLQLPCRGTVAVVQDPVACSPSRPVREVVAGPQRKLALRFGHRRLGIRPRPLLQRGWLRHCRTGTGGWLARYASTAARMESAATEAGSVGVAMEASSVRSGVTGRSPRGQFGALRDVVALLSGFFGM